MKKLFVAKPKVRSLVSDLAQSNLFLSPNQKKIQLNYENQSGLVG